MTSDTAHALTKEEVDRLNSLAVEVPIDDIKIGTRVRRDFSHVPGLAESIKDVGLIQPIVLSHDKTLIAGESRIRACRLLGWTTIRAVYRGCLNEAQLAVLEAEENNARSNLTWQERCLSIDKVHRIHATQAALTGTSWGVRETAALLEEGKSNTALLIELAGHLHANDKDIWSADSARDAIRILVKRKEDELNAILAKQTIPDAPKEGVKYVGPQKPALVIPDVGSFFTAGPSFAPGVTGPDLTDEMPGAAPTGLVVPLSQMLLKGDAVEVLKAMPADAFDHCITDWPYAIDMDMLNMQNQHGGLNDLDSVRDEHQVDENEALHAAIVPEIYRVLKPNSFFITWMDMMQWQRTYDLCLAAGFRVTRWPLVWHKMSACMNQTPQFNFTKNYEIAIVCRKGSATILRPQPSSVWSGGNDVEAKALGHPFAKPFGLWNWLFDAVVSRGQHILEPFAGRGSAIIPCIRRGIKFTAIEKKEEHYNSLVVNVSNVYRGIDPNVSFT